MTILDAVFPVFCLLVGMPCLLVPQKVQRFVLAFNERLGRQEETNSFRRSESYINRLRSVGVTTILGGVIIVLIELYAEDIVRAFM